MASGCPGAAGGTTAVPVPPPAHRAHGPTGLRANAQAGTSHWEGAPCQLDAAVIYNLSRPEITESAYSLVKQNLWEQTLYLFCPQWLKRASHVVGIQ